MSLLARDLMTTDVLTVTADLSQRELARFLVEHEISGAPVVDGRGRLLGVVSLADLARAAAEDEREGGTAPRRVTARPPETLELLFPEEPDEELPVEEEMADEELAEETVLRVADLMTTRVLAVGPETPIEQIARAMMQARYHRVLVTRGPELLGVISSTDLVRVIAQGAPVTVG